MCYTCQNGYYLLNLLLYKNGLSVQTTLNDKEESINNSFIKENFNNTFEP